MKNIIKQADYHGTYYTVQDVSEVHDFCVGQVADGIKEVALWVKNDNDKTIHMSKEQALGLAEKIIKIVRKMDE